MNVTICGMGYVGCVTAACFARMGHSVVGVDWQRTKADLLKILEDSEPYGLIPPMPKSFPKLSAEEKQQIVDWLATLK